MQHADAVALIADAVAGHSGVWVDLGAGGGTFTRALAEILGPGSRIYAVDRDADAVAALSTWAAAHAPAVTALGADLSRALDLDALIGSPIDGMLIANALHFIRDADEVLGRFARSLRPGGRVMLVEYDRRESTRWVPYPVPPIAGARRCRGTIAIHGDCEPPFHVSGSPVCSVCSAASIPQQA